MRNCKIAVLEYWPYAYNPTSGKLRAADSPQVAIKFNREAAPSAASERLAQEALDLVTNREEAIAWYVTDPVAVGAPGYAIITTKAIVSASANLRRFADLQALRGFSARIVTEDDWGGGIGETAADNIRRWLVAHYLELGIKYVLLIGDPSPATGDVPMKVLWPRYNQTLYRDAPSDYYYSDLTGNWDLDGDGISGEKPDDFGPGGIDRLPEVFVGRIPCYGSVDDLDRILEKTIQYESSVCGEWSRRVVLAMSPLDDLTEVYRLGEQIRRDVTLPFDYVARRVYGSDHGLDPPPERYPCTYEAVGEEWDAGAGFVCWLAHGSLDMALNVIDSARASNLDPTKPSFVFQGSCSNGAPEEPANLAYSLLRTGAIATLSASRAAWYYIGENDFTASDSIGGIAYQYSSLLLGDRLTCGRAAMEARLRVPMYIWANQLVFNVYGDPSASLNQPTPGAVAGTVLTIGGDPVPGAIVRAADGAASVQVRGDGSYLLGGLGDGPRDIIVSARGFYPVRFHGVPVQKAAATRLDARLAPAASGSVVGHIHDVFGVPVPEAIVKVASDFHEALSLADGSYLIEDLPPGVYILTASKHPYAEETIPECPVIEGGLTELDIVLHSRTGNAIANGGFEEGFSDGVASVWTWQGTYDYGAVPAMSSDVRKYGAFSQKLVLPPADSEVFAGVWQSAKVLPGNRYSLIAWQRCHADDSASPGAAICRLGYDPLGGADWQSPTVVWYTFDAPGDIWHAMFKEVVPLAPEMTVFLEARRLSPSGGVYTAWFDGVGLMGPITAPSTPLVAVGSRYQSDAGSITAAWSCPDADLAGYEWAVSANTGESGTVPGGGWMDVGPATSSARGGLALPNGATVRVLVRARNKAGIVSEVGVSEPIRIVTDAASVAAAKLEPEDAWIRIKDVCLTRMGQGPECFVQGFDRVAGMKVEGDWAGIPYLQPGTRVTVIGRAATRDSIHALVDARVLPSIPVASPRPLGMHGDWVCGQYFDNSGLLVMVAGRVSEVTADGFMIDDGTVPGGLAVRCLDSFAVPEVGRLVRVEGISTPNGLIACAAADVSELD